MNDYDLWSAAAGLEDLCGLEARWLAGEIAVHPAATSLDGRMDATVADVAERLVPVARAGLLISSTQAEVLSAGYMARPYVSGFITTGDLAVLRSGMPPHVKVVDLTAAPDPGAEHGATVVWADGVAVHHLTARVLGRELIDVHWGEALGDKALDALAEARQVHVYPASMHRPVIREFWTGLDRFAHRNGGSTR